MPLRPASVLAVASLLLLGAAPSASPAAFPVEAALPASPPGVGTAMDLADARHLRDPLAAAAALQRAPMPTLRLAAPEDLHLALHQAMMTLRLVQDEEGHAALHDALALLPPAVAREAAGLLGALADALRQAGAGDVGLLAASAALMDVVEARMPALARAAEAFPPPGGAGAEGACAAPWVTPPVGGVTLLAVGSPGRECFATGPTVLTIDLGGDDLYPDGAGVAHVFSVNPLDPMLVSLAVDMGGADHYLGMQASSHRGLGMVVDVAGDDTYDADTGQGAAHTGGSVAYLADLDGDDAYRCTWLCQGMGHGDKGVGLAAAGVLWDRAGNDRYASGKGSQGHGIYVGLGLLLDTEGDDTYETDGRGQGSGYAGGSGVFVDAAGRDTYLVTGAAGPAQGYLAERGTLGLFLDLAGRDAYFGATDGRNDWRWGQGVAAPLSPGAPASYGQGVDCELRAAPAGCLPLG